eukprot:11876414-Heterocapsa_arctica.AAC.1
MGHVLVTPSEIAEYGTDARAQEEKVTPPSRRASRKQSTGDPEDSVLPLPIYGLTLEESVDAWELEQAALLSGLEWSEANVLRTLADRDRTLKS